METIRSLHQPRAVVARIDAIRAWVRGRHVLTFLGYSAAGYTDEDRMLDRARAILRAFDPGATLVNSGGTQEGIGAVYAVAKQLGFATMGIVSLLALREHTPLAPCVDKVFYVADATWGGLLPGTAELSPTSQAIVAVSDTLIAFGGGAVAHAEMAAARAAGKPVDFVEWSAAGAGR